MAVPFYRLYLQAELERRVRANPRYSLRTLAQALDVDAGSLSRVLSGQRPLSLRAANHILARLRLSARQRGRFLESIFEEKKSQALKRVTPTQWREPEKAAPRPVDVALFRIIGNWYHSAILELTFVPQFRADPKWIGEQLGISATVAKHAVDRLLEAGLLQWSGGKLQKTNRSTETADRDRSTPHLRRHSTQMQRKAIRSFEAVPITERSSTGMTMAIDPQQLPLARQLIADFTQDLVRALETGRRTRVYHLAINLFPLQSGS